MAVYSGKFLPPSWHINTILIIDEPSQDEWLSISYFNLKKDLLINVCKRSRLIYLLTKNTCVTRKCAIKDIKMCTRILCIMGIFPSQINLISNAYLIDVRVWILFRNESDQKIWFFFRHIWFQPNARLVDVGLLMALISRILGKLFLLENLILKKTWKGDRF